MALLVFLTKSHLIDFRALARLLTAWPTTLAALALIFLDLFLMAVRLCLLFRPLRLRLTLASSLDLTLVSSFFATFLPGAAGGDLAKGYYAARENKGRRTEIVTILAFDRALGLFSVLVLPLLFAPLFPELVRSAKALPLLLAASGALAASLLACFLLCLYGRRWIGGAVRAISKLLPGREIPERAVAAIGSYRGHGGVLLAALAASLASNLTMIASTALAVGLLHPGNLSWKLCLVVPLGDVANSLPLTPGGLGVGETAFSALFALAGLAGGADALLCWRLWRAMAGLAGLMVYWRGVRREVFERTQEGRAG